MADPLTWNASLAYRMVRQRSHALTDRIRHMMTIESKLDKQVNDLTDRTTALRAAVATVESAGGDASSLKAQLEPLEPEHVIAIGKLSRLRESMAAVRASMKMVEMAHDGLHWNNFHECDLSRIDAKNPEYADYAAMVA